jgi:hypothetical protein
MICIENIKLYLDQLELQQIVKCGEICIVNS